MHRLSHAIRPYQRTLSSLSQVPACQSVASSVPPVPPSNSPSSSSSSSSQHLSTSKNSSQLRPVHVEFYEDDLLNELYAPTISTTEPEDVYSPRTRVNDAFIYGPKDNTDYDRQLRLEEETVNLAVDRYRKMTMDASKRGDVVTHRSANDLLLAWHNPFILALRTLQQQLTNQLNSSSSSDSNNASTTTTRTISADTNSDKKSTPKRPRRTKVDEQVSEMLASFPEETVSIIVIHTLLSALLRETANGLPLTRAAHLVSEAVRAEINLKKIVELRRQHQKELDCQSEAQAKLISAKSSRVNSTNVAKAILDRARKASTSSLASAVNFATACAEERESVEDAREHVLLGTKLIDVLMSVAKVKDKDGNFVPAVTHSLRTRRSDMVRIGILQFSDAALDLLKEETPSLADYVCPKQQPMVVRPRPWTGPADGAYLRCQSYLVRRTPGSYREVDNLLQGADLTAIFEGLNALGEQDWRVNENVLESAQALWDRGGGVAGLVTKTNCHIPEKKSFLVAEYAAFEKRRAEKEMMLGPQVDEETYIDADVDEDVDVDSESHDVLDSQDTKPGMLVNEKEEFDEKQALRKLRSERRKAQKMNRELVSMRADTEHRMQQAQRFAGEERIWLPHNVDFRGRAYPMPVHLQHMGCDLTRALLTFARPGVPLGERGVYWVKIHLANLLGADKMSLDERIDVAEDNMARAIEVGKDPLSDANLEWWSSAEDPFQLLSACCEIAQACGRYGNEQAMHSFESTLPVSMDGSCNGLQHYAALGRDIEGGTQVNLVPNDRPQDVYTGVARLVAGKVEQLANENDPFGLLMRDKVSRKIVKQTVMTSVYGVTLVGARQQIMNRLAELDDMPEEALFSSATRMAHLTLSSLGDIFEGATDTMGWLYECARRISKAGHKVEWTTPVGLPVMQPYRRTERKIVQTLMQRVTLQRSGEHSPVSTSRQRSAFPPNYVHSIDSAHMLLTAVSCRKHQLNFAAVHDSFWTNAAHVDSMNHILREEFIQLHQRDLLRELRESFLLRYPNVDFPRLPKRGQLDLDVVRHSKYFFS